MSVASMVRAQLASFVHIWTDYTAQSTIHGVRYISQGRTFYEKSWWILVLTASTVCCGHLIASVYDNWQRNPVINLQSSDETFPWDIPFPAVTVCPTQLLRKRVAISLKRLAECAHGTNTESPSTSNVETSTMPMLDTDFSNITLDDEFMNADNRSQSCNHPAEDAIGKLHAAAIICSRFNQSVQSEGGPFVLPAVFDTIRMIGHQFEDMAFEYDREIFAGFTEIMTESGPCFSLNILNHDDMFTDKIAPDFRHQYNPNMNPSAIPDWHADRGFVANDRAARHSFYPATFRNNDEHVNTFSIEFAITGAANESAIIDADGLCDTDDDPGYYVHVHAPDEYPLYWPRRHFVDSERRLELQIEPEIRQTADSIRKYAPANRRCVFRDEHPLEFYRSYTLVNCELECLARLAAERCGCVHFAMPRNASASVCALDRSDCVDRLRLDFYLGPLGVHRESMCGCPAACNAVAYAFDELTTVSGASVDGGGLRPADGKSIVRLGYGSPSFRANKRLEKGGPLGFLASCGGLLGLFMGVSFLSVAELVYYLLLRLLCSRKKKEEEVIGRANAEVIKPTLGVGSAGMGIKTISEDVEISI